MDINTDFSDSTSKKTSGKLSKISLGRREEDVDTPTSVFKIVLN